MGNITDQMFSNSSFRTMARLGRTVRLNGIGRRKKVKISNYRVVGNRLPTCDSLTKRGVPIDSLLCKLCNSIEETVYHIYTSYEVAMHIWSTVGS